MARPLNPASADQAGAVRDALQLLRDARDKLTAAEAPQALAKVRAAISSTEGALRHVGRRAALNKGA